MKRAIPTPRPDADPAVKAIKENLEVIMGQRGGKLEPLADTASLADVIKFINTLVDKLQ